MDSIERIHVLNRQMGSVADAFYRGIVASLCTIELVIILIFSILIYRQSIMDLCLT